MQAKQMGAEVLDFEGVCGRGSEDSSCGVENVGIWRWVWVLERERFTF